MSGWDDPISVVEDLDPEPEQPPGRFLLRDLVLGLVLLIGVLGFAGWQWWSQETRQSSYTQAVEALERNDLDQARALFAGASGYRDAGTRLADVDQRIAQRDSLYSSATTHIAAGNWPAALADLRALRDVQPDYRARSHLERIAVSEVARRTLVSSVALRDAPGSPPGLYYRKVDAWVYLPESDLDSRIRGNGASGFLVYDAPAREGDSGARHWMLANLHGVAPVSTPLPFDPELDTDFVWGEEGLWAFRYGRYATTGTPPVLNAMHGVDAAYMRFGSYVTQTISLAPNTGGADGEVLVDVDPTSDRYLVASWSGAKRWSSDVLSGTVTSLYLGSAGGERRLLYETHGVSMVGAQLRRDGNYVLVTTHTPSPGGGTYSLYLLDLTFGAPPRQIDGVRVRSYTAEERPTRWISSTFVRSGAYAGKVLAAVFNYDHTHLRLYDPRLPTEPMFDVEVPTSTGLMWAIARSDDRGLVVSGALSSYSPPYGRNDTQTVPVVQISPTGQVTQTGVLVDKHGYPYSVDLDPDHLAIVSVVGDEGKITWTVYLAPAPNPDWKFVQPTVVYTTSVSRLVSRADNPPVYANDGLITYTGDGTLRVRTYDGAVDIVLEEGIRALYPRRFMHDRYAVLR